MEVDTEGASQLNTLKRCSSEPNINVTEASPSSSYSTFNHASNSINKITVGSHLTERSRRFSASYLGLPFTPAKVPSRLDQIKLEECGGQSDREAAHEKEVQSAMMISQSWDELSLGDSDAMITDVKRPRSLTEPLLVLTSMYPCSSSPSPTRVGKQCFSPSLQQPVRNCTFTTSPGSSPTRQSYVRRSLSPIVLKPSPLSAVKRKIESDKMQNYFSPAKRFRAGSSSGGELTPEQMLGHPNYSLSSSSSGTSWSVLEDGTPNNTETSFYDASAKQTFAGFVPLPAAATGATSSSAFTFRQEYDSFMTSKAESETSAGSTEKSDQSETNEASMSDVMTFL